MLLSMHMHTRSMCSYMNQRRSEYDKWVFSSAVKANGKDLSLGDQSTDMELTMTLDDDFVLTVQKYQAVRPPHPSNAA